MKSTLIIGAMLLASGAASAQSFVNNRGLGLLDAPFNGITGLPTMNSGLLQLGELDATVAGTFTFTYLGNESSFQDAFHLLVNGSNLTESNNVGDAVSAFVATPGALNFRFEGAAGVYAQNGGVWHDSTSIALIGTGMTVTAGAAAGTYAFVLGYNDSYGEHHHLGDWDDYVVGVNFAPAVPEPDSYAMTLAGLGLLGALARRRRGA